MQNDYNNWQDDVNQKPAQTSSPAYEMPMKWHKFLIYFLLWLGGIANIGSGLMQLTGSQYGADADMVYRFFSGLQAIDVLFGIVTIALGGMQIFTRFKLANFDAVGPKMLVAVNVIAAAANLLYPVIASAVTGIDLSGQIGFGSIVGSLVMAVLNWNYYKNRAHLFYD